MQDTLKPRAYQFITCWRLVSYFHYCTLYTSPLKADFTNVLFLELSILQLKLLTHLSQLGVDLKAFVSQTLGYAVVRLCSRFR